MTTTNASLATTARVIRSRTARTRIGNHMSVARRHAVLDAFIARCNGPLVITAASYLRGVIGAGEMFVDRFGSSFGTKVSKGYQAQFGHKSARTALARRGMRIFDAFAYTADEIGILDEAARNYDRTRKLIAA